MHRPGTLSPRRWTPRSVKLTCCSSAERRKVTHERDLVGEHDHLPIGGELGQSVRHVSASNVIQRGDRVVQDKRRLAVVEVGLGEVAGESERSLLAFAEYLLDWLRRLGPEQRRPMPVLALVTAGALELDSLEPQPVRLAREAISDDRGYVRLGQLGGLTCNAGRIGKTLG